MLINLPPPEAATVEQQTLGAADTQREVKHPPLSAMLVYAVFCL